MNYYMYFGGQHFMAAAAAGVLNSYADGVNLHSDGLANQPKRSHLAHLHSILLAHANTIMGTPRPIPRHALGSRGLSAFVFGDGELSFLENANDNPGSSTYESRAATVQDAANASSLTAIATNCSFPIDASNVRYKGLKPAAATISTEAECSAACCASGNAARCNVYQFYEVKMKGQATQCWIGTPTHAEGLPPRGFRSGARVKPHDPAPAPPPYPSGAQTVQWNGKAYVLPAYSVTVVDRLGTVLYQTHNTSAVATTRRVFRPATALPLEWSCWSELSLIAERSRATEAVQSAAPLEQLNLTQDRTEYLLYVTTIASQQPKSLKVSGRIANAYSVFIDGVLIGEAWNAAHSYGSKNYEIALSQNDTADSAVRLRSSGINYTAGSTTRELAILSTSLGMHSHVTSRALDFKGVVGAISLDGVTLSTWRHIVGLAGEHWHAAAGNESLGWGMCSNKTGPLTWRKTMFSIPATVLNNPMMTVMLDVSGLSRGHFFINGIDLGKYWTVGAAGLGPTQRYYQLPRSLLRSDTHNMTNLLVMADELGAISVGSARGVRVVFSSMKPVE